MNISYILEFLAVMISMIAADICWALYFIKVSERKPIQAGIWGSSIVLFGAITTVGYVHDPTLLVAAVLGAFIGTTGTVYYKTNKESKNNLDK